MIRLIRRVNGSTNRHTGKLVAIGFLAVAVRNWRMWQDDKVTTVRLRAERGALPSLTRRPRVSILVAAWNEEARIDMHLQSFLSLAYSESELILCAGGADRTFECARAYAGERIIVLRQLPGEGKQRALAKCFERATGETIYLTDADCLLEDDALLRLLAPIVDEEEAVTTGGSRPLDTQLTKTLPFYLWAGDLVSHAHTPTYTQGILGRNACITRAAIDTIGGLNFTAPTGTDYHLARRLIDAGFAIRHVGSSSVATEYPESVEGYRRKQSRWLRNLLIYGRQYRSKSDVQHTLRTIATGLVMLLLPFLSTIFGRLPMVAWLVLLSQAVCAKLRYVGIASRLSYRTPSKRIWPSILLLTLLDFAVWVSPAFDVLTSKRRTQW